MDVWWHLGGTGSNSAESWQPVLQDACAKASSEQLALRALQRASDANLQPNAMIYNAVPNWAGAVGWKNNFNMNTSAILNLSLGVITLMFQAKLFVWVLQNLVSKKCFLQVLWLER